MPPAGCRGLDSDAFVAHSFDGMPFEHPLRPDAAAQRFVVFVVDERRFALPLAAVDRVVAAVAVDPLAHAPQCVCGTVCLRGERLAVFDLRRHLELAPHRPRLSDQLVLAHDGRRRFAMVVDAVEGVSDGLADGVTAIAPLAQALSPRDARRLADALAALDEPTASA